ncbi:YbeD family protein [Marinomonas sp. 2405UD68-3]|uniref:YbeD family protein n=1 Tax=Marinomonas sp. 2405UD68-3 TaxID=3391835 RepID=UPI0039C9804D
MALITKNGDVAKDKDTSKDAPKIIFPCENYMVKVVALESEAILMTILDVFKKHAPEIDEKNIGINRSSKGKFISFTFRIVAVNEAQLAGLHKDLVAIADIKMVM